MFFQPQFLDNSLFRIHQFNNIVLKMSYLSKPIVLKNSEIMLTIISESKRYINTQSYESFYSFICSRPGQMGNDLNKQLTNQYLDSLNPQTVQKDHSLPEFQLHSLNILPIQVRRHLDKHKPFADKFLHQPQAGFRKFAQGAYYHGPTDPSGKPQGWGKIIKKDGSILIAEFSQGEIVFGRYILEDGSYYEGQFSENKISGKGIYIKDHLIYEGNFQNNLFHGHGLLKVANRYSFEGEFVEGRKKQGTLIWYEDEDDEKSLMKYAGPFDADELFMGKGKLVGKLGIYRGQFFRGMKNGEGLFQFTNGMVYSGTYLNDKKQGQGILYNYQISPATGQLTYAQKDELICYRGQFSDDLPHGEGDVFNKSKGTFVTQEWVYGVCKPLLKPEDIQMFKKRSQEQIESKEGSQIISERVQQNLNNIFKLG